MKYWLTRLRDWAPLALVVAVLAAIFGKRDRQPPPSQAQHTAAQDAIEEKRDQRLDAVVARRKLREAAAGAELQKKRSGSRMDRLRGALDRARRRRTRGDR